MAVTKINIAGSHELDLDLIGGSTATAAGGVVTVTQGGASNPANEVLASPNGSSGPLSVRTLVPADLPVATSSTKGIVQPDNTTITISSGVITAIGAAPSGAAGGDLTGTYPNPTVAKVNGAAVPASQTYVGTNASGQIIAASAPTGGMTQLTGDVTAGPGSGSQAATLAASGVTAGTYPKVTVDAKGRVTAGTSLAAADIPNIAESQVTNLTTDLAAKAPTTRNLNTTAPLTGGGDLSADRTLGVSVATTSTTGVVKADGTTITVDGTGKITAIGAAPSGAAGGDLGGTYPNPTVTATHLSTPLPVAQGGTGTTTPGLVAGTNVSVSGTWPNQTVNSTYSAPLVLGFSLASGATGTNVAGYAIASRAGSFTKCKVVTKTSDSGTALTFTVKQNGTAVFTTSNTVAAGTAAGTISTFTNLTSSPLPAAADDLFQVDITSGSASWACTIQME